MSKKVEVITEKETTDVLSLIEMTDSQSLFLSNGAEQIISMVQAEVQAFEYDLTTKKGRDAVASMSFKIKRVKTAFEKVKKDLTADWKRKAKEVDTVGKTIRERLEEMDNAFRVPLIEWEEEQEKIKEAERLQAEIDLAHQEAVYLDTVWQKEKEAEAERIAKEAELEEQRKELEERERKLNEEFERIERIKAEEQAKHEAEKQRLIDEENARIAEEQRLAAEAKRKQELEVRLEEERKAAAEEERKRIEAEQERQRLEQERREENKRIVTRTHNQIVDAIVLAMSDVHPGNQDEAKSLANAILKAMVAGKIPKVTITY